MTDHHALATARTIHPIALRNGGEIPAGARIEWGDWRSTVHVRGDTSYQIHTSTAARAAGYDVPTLTELREWTYDGVCESVTGAIVEPDGRGPDGAPSWWIALGLI